MVSHVPDSLRIVARGDAVFCNHHGFPVAIANPANLFVESVRIDAPTHHRKVVAAAIRL
jgi:hypothetical protein